LTTSAEPGEIGAATAQPAVVPALEMEHVAAAYERDVVLEDVTGTVAPGGSLALIGPNGAGKTTLLKAILGLVKVVRGRIEVLGEPPGRTKGAVAYVPQAESLDATFPVSALQVVLMGRYRLVGWGRRPGREDKAAASRALEQVGLGSVAKERFGTLSGGQRQRVLLARAVAQEARLLVLDEPFNGVDTVTTDALLTVLHELRAEGVAVVMSTHDLSIAHLACEEACLLNHHQIAFGPIGVTLTPSKLEQTYGGGAIVLVKDSTIITTR
jgi:manganese/iron transport system ATP-binding protein